MLAALATAGIGTENSNGEEKGGVDKKIIFDIYLMRLDLLGAKWCLIYIISTESDTPVAISYKYVYDPYLYVRMTRNSDKAVLPNLAGGTSVKSARNLQIQVVNGASLVLAVPLLINKVLDKDDVSNYSFEHLIFGRVKISQ